MVCYVQFWYGECVSKLSRGASIDELPAISCQLEASAAVNEHSLLQADTLRSLLDSIVTYTGLRMRESSEIINTYYKFTAIDCICRRIGKRVSVVTVGASYVRW